MLITILLILAGIVALFLVAALLTKREYHVHREIVINAPADKVFDYIKHTPNHDNFNKWLMADPAMEKDFRGTDGTVGFIYSWSGNKHGGAGEQEIVSIIEGKQIEIQTRFKEAFAGIAPRVIMTTESMSANQARVTWGNESRVNYPINIMLPMIKKMLAKDLDTSLGHLKRIMEQ